MKRAFALILMIVLCIALAVPAFAADSNLEENKDSKFTGIYNTDGIYSVDASGNFTGSVYNKNVPAYVSDVDCLKITAYVDADTLPEDKRDELKAVYEALCDGSMTLPYEKVKGVDPENMVIRDLMDISFFDTEECEVVHVEEIKKDGVTATITFQLCVAADDVVAVMSYVDGEWVLAEEITNNGDGTVTVVFEDICPVAIAVEA